jgi:hypothetical protein
MRKTRIIRFRLEDTMYNYIRDLVTEMRKHDQRWNISEFLRMVIGYFLMAYILGELKKPYWKIREEFVNYAGTYFPPKSDKKQKKQ